MFRTASIACTLLGLTIVTAVALANALAAAPSAPDNNTPTAKSSKPSAEWPLFRGDALSSGVAHSSLPEKLELLWKFPTKDGGFTGSAAIVGGVVYVGSLDGNLYAIDLKTGEQKWSVKTELGFTSSPAVRDGRVYIGDSDGKFYCLSAGLPTAEARAVSGKLEWAYDCGGEINSSANFYQDKILVGSQDATLYCLTKSGKLAWKYSISDQIRCTPTVVENRAFLAGCDGKLHIIDLDHGTSLATVSIDAPTGATPAVLGDYAYFGTQGSLFFAVDWKKAEIAWRYKSERAMPFQSSAAVTDSLVFVGGQDKLVHAIDTKTGDKVWTYSTKARVDSSPVVVGNRIFVGSSDGRLYGLDRKGKLVWDYEAGGKFTASPAVAENCLVIGNEDGTLYCFGAK